MKLNTKGRYAVMAMADLAKINRDQPTCLSEISLRQGISISTCIDLYTYKHKYTSVQYGMETRALVSGQFLDR